MSCPGRIDRNEDFVEAADDRGAAGGVDRCAVASVTRGAGRPGLSSASVSALLTKESNQIKLSTLIALCTALQCTPDDLFDVDTTAVKQPITPNSTKVAANDSVPSRRGRSMPPI